jgi:hypothetical protein
MNKKFPYVLFTLFGAAAFSGTAQASCGSAFCMVNTNWSNQGVWTEPGARFDLRYEYINQDQPRAGRDKVGVGEIPAHHDEVQTVNRNYFATVDYGFNDSWGASVTLPAVDRKHRHIHNHEGEAEEEAWDFTELGDVRVLGRYQFPAVQNDPEKLRFSGVTFGLKLPTGKYDVANDEGEVAERSLQPGTGTTDLLIGAYYREALPLANSSWFIQAQAQLAMNSRADFKPGKQLGIDLGYRYDASDKLGLMLQLNYHVKDRDDGAQAEPEDSGSRNLSLSPGVSYAFAKGAQIYAFLQKPIYQSVNGVQLTADWSAVAGVSAKF